MILFADSPHLPSHDLRFSAPIPLPTLCGSKRRFFPHTALRALLVFVYIPHSPATFVQVPSPLLRGKPRGPSFPLSTESPTGTPETEVWPGADAVRSPSPVP